MSMELCLKRVSEIELARYAREGFEPVDEFVGTDPLVALNVAELRRKLAAAPKDMSDPRAVQAWIANAGKLAQDMAAKAGAAPPDASAARPRKGAETLNLHKSWHALHYLFTGRAWDGPLPAATLLLGGKEIGEDLGYGPARALQAKDTMAFAQFLSGLSADDLVRRLDLRAMRKLEIYCAEDDDEGSQGDLQEDIEHFFPQLQAYVGEAARNHAGLVIWMS